MCVCHMLLKDLLTYLLTKMHQIRFRLSFALYTPLGSLQRSSRPLAGFKGSYFQEEGIKEEGERIGGEEGEDKR